MSYFNKFPKTTYDFLGNGLGTKIPDIFRQGAVVKDYLDPSATYQKCTILDERPDQLSYRLYGSTEWYWTFFIVNDSLREVMNRWPLASESLNEFIDSKYPNTIIRPYRNVENSQTYNSIAGKFPIGTTLIGATSGAVATIIARHADTNQLVVEYVSGTFTEGERLNGFDADGAQASIINTYEIREEKYGIHHFEDADGVTFSNYDNLLNSAFIVTNDEWERNLNDEKSQIRVVRKDYIEEFGAKFRRAINE